MKPLPIAEWLRSLDQMEASLAEILAEVDRHDAATATLLAEPKPAAALAAAETLLGRLDERLAEHDRRQAVASEQSASLDRWITEQSAAITAWRGAFTRWASRIQQDTSGSPEEVPVTA